MPEILSREKKIASLTNFIRTGLKRGLSATALYNQTRKTPLGIRKKDFLGLVREIQGVQKKAADTIKYTRTEYLFPKGVDAVNWNLKKPFLIRANILFAGEEKPRVFSMYSDTPVMPEEAVRGILTMLEESSTLYQEEIDILGKNVVSYEILPTAVSREFSPGWLKRRFGF